MQLVLPKHLTGVLTKSLQHQPRSQALREESTKRARVLGEVSKREEAPARA